MLLLDLTNQLDELSCDVGFLANRQAPHVSRIVVYDNCKKSISTAITTIRPTHNHVEFFGGRFATKVEIRIKLDILVMYLLYFVIDTVSDYLCVKGSFPFNKVSYSQG